MHAFKIGATAHYVGSPIGAKPQLAEVLACLPSEHGEPSYRVRCLGDGHERRVVETDLRAEAQK
jgi:hypothetical protein